MFVALPVPPPIRAELEEFLAPRLDAFDVAWTPPEHWHLTLAFANDAPERVLDTLIENLERACAKRSPIPLLLAGSGAFPDPLLAKVLFLAPEHSDAAHLELGRLAAGVRTAMTTSGIEIDGARFVPHVTLARSRRGMRAHRWLSVLDTFRSSDWLADELTLIASHPTGRGWRHEVLATLPIGPSAD